MFTFIFTSLFILAALWLLFVVFGSFAIALVTVVGLVGLHDTHDPVYIIPAAIGLYFTLSIIG